MLLDSPFEHVLCSVCWLFIVRPSCVYRYSNLLASLAGSSVLPSFRPTMASLSFYLAVSVLLAQSTVAFNCSKAPIYVDIHRRAVHDSPVFQYGSFIGVGSPAQNHSLWPSLAQNHTSFAAPTFCGGNGTLRECDTSTGGFFNSKDSTTYVNGFGSTLHVRC